MTTEGLQWRVAALNSEWAQMSQVSLPDAWCEECRALAEVTSLDNVLDAVRSHPDEVLRCLLAQCRSGDTFAGRVVIQAMLPKMVLMAKRDPIHDLGAYLAVLWERVQTYPLDRRPHKVAANLALDTLKGVKKQSSNGRLAVLHTDWSSPGILSRAAEVFGRRKGGAARVLNRAVSLGVIDSSAREVLSMVYLDGRSATQAGRELGLTADAVRARCSRAVRRLRLHAPELADVAG